jgi:hypothetical protein
LKFTTILLSAILPAMPAAVLACSCVAPPESAFLHVAPGRDGQATLYLPANARGMLFHARPMLQWEGSDKDGRTRLSRVPPPLQANRFTITELKSGKPLAAALSPLFTDQLDALMGRPRYLMDKTTRDISAEVRRAHGLFRVAPAGGFSSGRSYRVTYTPDTGQPMTVLVRLGPAVVPTPGQTFSLQLDGGPVRRLLPVVESGGSCSNEVGAAVQALRIGLPPRYEAYRTAMSYFVLHKQGADFEIQRYVSSACDIAPFGGSNLGPLKELAYSSCNAAPVARKAKALVGMLELDDKLVETAVIDIRLDKAAGPACSTLKQPELKDFN